jgi:hypothetical protein
MADDHQAGGRWMPTASVGAKSLIPFFAIALFLTAGSTTGMALEDPRRPPVFAAYYVWYSTGPGPHGKWCSWGTPAQAVDVNGSRGHDPSRFVTPGVRDISSAAYPLVGPYDSDDPEVVRWHIRLAKAAGIEAFLVSWWGPATWQAVPGLTERAFEKVVLPIAEEEHFHVALIDETAQFNGDVGQVSRWAAEYLAKFKDSPAYLKIDGRPVYYLYQVCFNPKLKPAEARDLMRDVEAKVGRVYWMIDKISNADNRLHLPEEWLNPPLGDAYVSYGTFSVFRQWRYEDLIDRYRNVVNQAHKAGLKMMMPAHPGHDNSRLRNDPFVIPRDDGRTLRGYLWAVRDSGADFVLLTSWNEWPETTVVEPSSSWADPYQYLRIVAEFNGVEFKPPPEPPRIRWIKGRQ